MLNRNIVLYNNYGHCVEFYSKNIKDVILPKSINVSSIVVMTNDNKLLNFNYISESTTGDIMYEENEQLDIVVYKGSESWTGKALSMDGNNITIVIKNEILTIAKYDKVVILRKEYNIYPKLKILNNNKDFYISYMFENISWIPTGTLLINNDDSVELLLNGIITNQTNKYLKGNLSLHASSINQPNELIRESKMVMMSARSSNNNDNEDDYENKKDYIRYDLGKQEIKNTAILNLGIWSGNATKIYSHNIKENNKILYGYEFISPSNLPKTSFKIYNMDNNKISTYIGSNSINETNEDETITFLVGTTHNVTSKTNYQSSYKKIRSADLVSEYNDEFGKEEQEYNVLTELFQTEIENKYDFSIILLIKHYIGSRYLINAFIELDDNNYDEYELNKGIITWRFNINPLSIINLSGKIITI